MMREELIKALRKCGKASADRCWDCTYYDREPWCESALANDAADALEAADKRIAELEADKKTLVNVVKDKSDFRATKDAMRIAELEAQLQKEGEWIVEEIDDCGYKWRKWRCSACREVVKRGWKQTKDGEKPKHKYCPNCGAKMTKGEQDE